MVASTGSVCWFFKQYPSWSLTQHAENPKMVPPVFEREISRFPTRMIFFCSQFIKDPNGWKKNHAVNDIFHDPKMISAQVLFTSNGDFLFITEACSPKADGNPLLMSGTGPGIREFTMTIPPSFPPKNPPQSPQHPDTFIPKKTVVCGWGCSSQVFATGFLVLKENMYITFWSF